MSNSNEQQFASCAKRKTTSKLSALKTHLGREWAFYDPPILSIARGPCVVHCTVSKREEVNGGAGSRQGAGGGLDEMN